MELKIKGTSQVTLRKLVQKQGQEFEQRFIEKLTPEQLKYYNCMPVSWIPLETDPINNTLVKCARMLFPNDPLAVQKTAQEMAKISMPAFYQIFLRIPSVEFVFKRSASIWKSFYQKGDFISERAKDKEMHITLIDFPDFPSYLLQFNSGFMLGIGELLGLKKMRMRKDINNPNAWKWVLTWE